MSTVNTQNLCNVDLLTERSSSTNLIVEEGGYS